jgi:transposase
MTGVDLVAVHGISTSIAQTIVSEIGTDMRTWPTEKHVCSWLGLAPKNEISGGKVLKSRPMKRRNRAAQAFRMAAQSVFRADCAFGAFCRRLKGRLGPAQALVATAHKIARTVYHMLQDQVPYYDIGAAEYNQRFRERELKYLQKKATAVRPALRPLPDAQTEELRALLARRRPRIAMRTAEQNCLANASPRLRADVVAHIASLV